MYCTLSAVPKRILCRERTEAAAVNLLLSLHGLSRQAVHACVIAPGLSVSKLLASVTHSLQSSRPSSRQYLVDINAVFLHVVSVVDLAPLSKLHGQDSLCGQVPVDDGNLQRHRDREGKAETRI